MHSPIVAAPLLTAPVDSDHVRFPQPRDIVPGVAKHLGHYRLGMLAKLGRMAARLARAGTERARTLTWQSAARTLAAAIAMATA